MYNVYIEAIDTAREGGQRRKAWMCAMFSFSVFIMSRDEYDTE